MSISDIINIIYSASDIILPSIGTIIIDVILAILFALLFLVFVFVLLWKIEFFKRNRKYYNMAIKLYIPYIVITTFYISILLGLITGVAEVLEDKNEKLVEYTYRNTVSPIIDSSEHWDTFFTRLNEAATEIDEKNEKFSLTLLFDSIDPFSFQDSTSLKVNSSFSEEMSAKINSKIYYALVMGAILSKNGNTSVSYTGNIKVEKFQSILAELKTITKEDVEDEIKLELSVALDELISTQYSSMFWGTILLYLGLLLPLFVEFFLYKNWLKERFENKGK
ncbi:MAG: hypothetical protein HRT58_00415 [Crocinitomicaceae bacterium]|nr:hypothetical protein [Flavobacteriales bacterium]NQZ34084.1 hypothetical protein [Crocinitomicaceae bacterium]